VVIRIFGRSNRQHCVLWLSVYLEEVRDSTVCSGCLFIWEK